jgi:hypothetical protein
MDAPEIPRVDPAKVTTNGTPAVRTRQGLVTGRVLTVLVISVLLGVVALAVCYFAVR